MSKRRMLRKLLAILVALPVAVALVTLSVLNRQPVTVALDPLGALPYQSVSVPLFLLVLGSVALGVVLGGAAAWLRQSRWRRATHRLREEARALRAENDRLTSARPLARDGREPRLPGAPSRSLALSSASS